EIAAGGFVAGVAQLLEQLLDFNVARGLRRIEPRQRIEMIAFESRPLRSGEGDFDAEVGRALGDERLRREEGIDGEFGPAAATHEMLLEQRVVDVVPRISLVTGE